MPADRATYDRMRLQADLRKLADIEARIERTADVLQDRDRLQAALAPVITDALREAGREDHDRVASTIAPYVVRTIRSEILNSQDELVEAIHPRLGTLIRQAVTNAIEEINRKVDEALPVDRWVAALKGRLTGVSPAGMLGATREAFEVREALLIDRRSGILLARRVNEAAAIADGADEDLVAGMIAAVLAFAEDAYGTGAGELRRLELTGDRVYLRASATRILAVRCAGHPPPGIEGRMDELLERALATGGRDAMPARLVEDLGAVAPPPGAAGVSASRILGTGLAAVVALLLVWWGTGAVSGAYQSRWHAMAEAAATADPTLAAWPLAVEREGEGALVVRGLVPDAAALAQLEARMAALRVPVPVRLAVDIPRAPGR